MFSFGIGRTKPTSGSIFGHGFGHSQETVGIWQNPIAEFGHASAQDFGSRVAPTWPWVEEYDRVEQEWYYANEETGETTWDQPPECKPPTILYCWHLGCILPRVPAVSLRPGRQITPPRGVPWERNDIIDAAIRKGSKLEVVLSGVLADGTRTARFSVDEVECAVFAGIEDRGGSTDWVAGASSTTVICCRSLLACSFLALGSCRLDAIVLVPFAGVTLSPHAAVRIGSAGEEPAQPDPEPAEPAGLIQPTKFVRQLSYRALHFEHGETIAGTESDARNLPAACVAVTRGGATTGFAMALEVVALPAEGFVYFSFGLGLARPEPGSMFGGSATNTCGIFQNPCAEGIRHAQSQRLGLRVDRDDTVLVPVLKAGSRLAVNLSKRDRGGVYV